MLKHALTGLIATCVAGALPLSQAAHAQVYCANGDAQIQCNGSECYCPSPTGNRGASAQPVGASPEEIAHQQRVAASSAYNDQGIAAFSRGDWAEAVRFFQLSLDNDPGDSVVSANLANARERLRVANESKAASAKIDDLLDGYSRSVTPMNSSGGLDFDQGSTEPAPQAAGKGVKASQPLDFGDPTVVDARNAPSGLPKAIEAEIPATAAGDRVRKGFQAIATHDWKLAIAWFGDALNHDPHNAGIARLLDLSRFTFEHETQRKQTASSTTPPVSADGMAHVNAVMDRQMAESESHTVAKGDDKEEDAAANAAIDQARESEEIDALVDKGLNEDLARSLAEYNASHAHLNAAISGLSSGWRAFFDALFKRPDRILRPLSVAGVRG